MNWDAIGAVSQAIGAVAVVAPLIYLSMQIRQCTLAARSTAFQNIVSQSIAFTGDLAKNPELLMVFRAGMNDLASLNPTESARFDFLLLSLLRRFEIVHYQCAMGFITADDWEGLRASLFIVVGSMGGRAWWKCHDERFNSGFRRFIDDELRKRQPVVSDTSVVARESITTQESPWNTPERKSGGPSVAIAENVPWGLVGLNR